MFQLIKPVILIVFRVPGESGSELGGGGGWAVIILKFLFISEGSRETKLILWATMRRIHLRNRLSSFKKHQERQTDGSLCCVGDGGAPTAGGCRCALAAPRRRAAPPTALAGRHRREGRSGPCAVSLCRLPVLSPCAVSLCCLPVLSPCAASLC